MEDGLSEKEELFAKIIRDADKIDILFEAVEMFWQGNEEIVENSTITEDVIKQFNQNKLIKRRKKERTENSINKIITVIAFIFDLNFDISLKYVQENNYIDILVDRIEYKNDDTKQKMEDIRKCAKEYIKNKHN